MKKIKDKTAGNQVPLILRGLGRSILFFFIFFGIVHAEAQTISYLIPDIGSSGQTTYMEIIGPYNQDGNFGADGIYANNPGDIVRVVCANNADTGKIKIGPVCVSWNGKMLSTQVFVMPGQSPNSADWQLLSAAYQIPLQVVLNNTTFSNTDIFYIVQPQAAIIASGAVNLGGGGSGGIRSRRGAMIVDNLVLNSGANVTVSTADCDPGTAGNQGFLPLHVISRGDVLINNGAAVSGNAPGGQNTDGGPGGGGGGTESWTNNNICAGGPNVAGSGFTGGGTEKACCTETPGTGSGSGNNCIGCGGNSLNGVPGGAGGSVCTDANEGAGGTGHPFGSSGVNGTGPGGYGGGSGWSAYAGGGNASDGTAYAAGSQGKTNGNAEVTPFAGGGGGSGGVAGPGTSRGGGGGGGGALSLHAYYSSVLQASGQVNSNGGNGVLGATGYRGGGGGSGGTLMFSGKLNSQGTGTVSVTGGAGGVGGGGPGGNGGAGRVRIDGPFTTIPTINPVPGVNSSSSYIGPSTDTSRYVARSFTLSGTGNGQDIRIYLKPITQPWQLLTTLSGYGTAWTQNIVLPCPDTMFLIAVAQNIPSPSATQYTPEPAWAFSQAATNILIVKDALKAYAGNDLSICPASCIALGGAPSATGGIPPYTYLWSPLTGLNNSTLANPTTCLFNDTSYVFTVTDSSGCFYTDSINVTIYPKPIANFNFTSVCLNQTMNFNDLSIVSSGSIAGRLWDYGDGSALDTAANPSHIYATPGTYSVTLIVASDNGCKDTISKNAVVHPLPSVYFNALNVCDRSTVYFNNFSTIALTDTIQSYTWNFDDGSPLNNNPSISHLYSTSGSYSVQLIVVSNFGCSDSITKTVIVHPNPVADFNNTSVCHTTTTQFTDTSSTALGTMSTWSWTFGDGSPLNSSASPPHLFTNAGNHNVTLIVTNSFGCKDTITKPVIVYFNPVAGFTFNDVCFGDTMNFVNTSSVDTSTSISTYLWSFGDASPTGSLQNQTHYYSNAGTYSVTLVGTTIDGCSNAISIPVNTFDRPTSAFTVSNTCLFDSAMFTNTSLNPTMGSTAGWSWDFGDGTPLNTTEWSPGHLYAIPGNYQFTLITYSSNLACSDTLKDSITVFPMPVASFNFSNVCLYQTTTFNDLSTVPGGSITNRTWNFGDGTGPNSNPNPTHVYATSGAFFVSLIIITNNGCKDTMTKSVIIHPQPNAQFSSANVCYGSIEQFNDLSTIPTTDTLQSWAWNFGDGSPVFNNQNTSHLFAAAGSYTVQLLVISNFGCIDSISKTSIVNPNPVVNFITPDTVGCEPLCISFQNLSSISSGFNNGMLWDFGDGSPTSNLLNSFHCYNNDSVYLPNSFNLTLTVTSDSGCVSTLAKNNYITVYPNPVAGFSVQPQTTTITDPVISITNLSTGGNFWNWNFGDQDTSSVFNPPSHTYPDTGIYIITLIVSTQYNCIDTMYQTIVIEPDFLFYVPNAFTPNDDGVNDTFYGKGIFITNYEMSIFDRWGNLIFFSDSIDKQWDGKANHGTEIAQRDVYIYSFKVTDIQNKKHTYKGIVTLVR